jgi:hypothetical protein
MTKVIHLPSPRAGTRVHSCAHQPTKPGTTATAALDPVTRQQAIENALSMALYFIRQPGDTASNVWAATARTNRALTLLKQASQGNATASPANTHGRA